MKPTPQSHPKLFNRLKSVINKQIAKQFIIVNRKKFRTNVGRAYPYEKVIKIPIITNLESVYIIFHEIGHIVFNHCPNPKKRTYMQELEAEQYSLRNLRKFNIHKIFPHEYNMIHDRAKSYIIQHIMYEIENGLKFNHITSSAMYFCQVKYRPNQVILKKNHKRRKKR